MCNVTYSPSHCQASAPMINIQSTLCTAPNLCKNVSLTNYLVAPVIHIQSLQSQMCRCAYACMCVCTYIHTYSSQFRDAGWAKYIKKIGTAVNACAKEIFPHAIGSPALYLFLAQSNIFKKWHCKHNIYLHDLLQYILHLTHFKVY